jgi:hypothetical protein
VSIQAFAIAFLFGASAVALWVDHRFPDIAPSDLSRALLRTILVIGASRLLFTPVWEAALARSPAVVAVFSVAFPVLTLVLLCAIWSIRQLQEKMRQPY